MSHRRFVKDLTPPVALRWVKNFRGIPTEKSTNYQVVSIEGSIPRIDIGLFADTHSHFTHVDQHLRGNSDVTRLRNYLLCGRYCQDLWMSVFRRLGFRPRGCRVVRRVCLSRMWLRP